MSEPFIVFPDEGRRLDMGTFSPAGMVAFFEELAAPELAGTATPALLDEIAGKEPDGSARACSGCLPLVKAQ